MQDKLHRIRFTAWTSMLPRGSGSRRVKIRRGMSGLARMHQFSKVELVSITTPEQIQ